MGAGLCRERIQRKKRKVGKRKLPGKKKPGMEFTSRTHSAELGPVRLSLELNEQYRYGQQRHLLVTFVYTGSEFLLPEVH